MSIKINPITDDFLSKLHTLQFYILCPDGRRFHVKDLENEYKKNPRGIFMLTFEKRPIVVLEAVFVTEIRKKSSWWDIGSRLNNFFSVNIVTGEHLPSTTTRLYWRKAFYLSTGTSGNPFSSQSNLRRNNWMPFDGLVVKGNLRKRDYDGKLIGVKRPINGFYVEKTTQFHLPSFAKTITNETDTLLFKTFGKFLPESSIPINFFNDTFETRMETVSYILASYDLGGNAFSKETMEEINNTEGRLNKRIYTPGEYFLPSATTMEGQYTKISMLYPKIADRMKSYSSTRIDYLKLINEEQNTSVKDINEFLDKHGAIARMNLFRSLGEHDIPVPGLERASVLIDPVPYPLPLQAYNQLIDTYVSYLFTLYGRQTLTKEELIQKLQAPLEEIIEFFNSNSAERDKLISPADEGFSLFFYQAYRSSNDEDYDKNFKVLRNYNTPYVGGRRKRTRSQKYRKMNTRKLRT